MAITNHERVGKAMDLLKQGLGPFVERELISSYKDKAGAEAMQAYLAARERCGFQSTPSTMRTSRSQALPSVFSAS